MLKKSYISFFQISGEDENQFKLSRIATPCQSPVNNMNECYTAANLAKSTLLTSENKTGQGIDLPSGCISDRSNLGIHYVFWNPKGVALSSDSRVRSICKESDFSYEGILISSLL